MWCSFYGNSFGGKAIGSYPIESKDDRLFKVNEVGFGHGVLTMLWKSGIDFVISIHISYYIKNYVVLYVGDYILF